VAASHENGVLRLSARVIDSAPSFRVEAAAADSAVAELHFAVTNTTTATAFDRLTSPKNTGQQPKLTNRVGRRRRLAQQR
jgi:hypothetical protein